MAKPKPFSALRAVMTEYGYEQIEIAHALGKGITYVNQRFCCTYGKQWELSDMYGIMKFLRLPFDQLHIYFPPDGVTPQKKAS